MAISTLDIDTGVIVGTGAGPFSASHTLVAGTNRKLQVWFSTKDTSGADRYATNVTYSGVALTEIGRHWVADSAGASIGMWEMLEASLPANGAHTLEVTVNGSISHGISVQCVLFDGTAQALSENWAEAGSTTDGKTFDLSVTGDETTGRIVAAINTADGAQAITPSGSLAEIADLSSGSHRIEIAVLDSPSVGVNALNWTTGANVARWVAGGCYLTVFTVTGTAAGAWGALTATAAATVTHNATAAGTWGAWTATAQATPTTPTPADEHTGRGAVVWEHPRPRPQRDPRRPAVKPPPRFTRHARARAHWGRMTATAQATVYAVDNDDDLLALDLL